MWRHCALRIFPAVLLCTQENSTADQLHLSCKVQRRADVLQDEGQATGMIPFQQDEYGTAAGRIWHLSEAVKSEA